MLKPSFTITGDQLLISNARPRSHTVVMLVAAAAILVLLIGGKSLPEGLGGGEGAAPPEILLLGLYLCASAAFWWSTVRIDKEAAEVEIIRRWGLFRSKRKDDLSGFTKVALRADSDNEISVYLEGTTQGMEVCNNRAILWGREYEESLALTKAVAAFLGLEPCIHWRPDPLSDFVPR